LAIAGGGVGLLLAAASLQFLIHLAPQDIPRLAETRLDGAVLVFTVGLSLLAGLLFGVFPAWLASGTDPQEALAEGARSTTGSGRSRARDLLIVGEVAVSVLLTIGAALLVKSFVGLLRMDLGFKPDRVVTAIIVLPQSRYPDLASNVASIASCSTVSETCPACNRPEPSTACRYPAISPERMSPSKAALLQRLETAGHRRKCLPPVRITCLPWGSRCSPAAN